MDLTGRIIAVLPPQSGTSARTGNPWMSQEYVIEVPGQYPKRCVFRVRWFNDIRAYNVLHGVVPAVAGAPMAGAPMAGAPMGGVAPFPPQQPAVAQPAATPFPPAQEPAGEGGSADDLPF